MLKGTRYSDKSWWLEISPSKETIDLCFVIVVVARNPCRCFILVTVWQQSYKFKCGPPWQHVSSAWLLGSITLFTPRKEGWSVEYVGWEGSVCSMHHRLIFLRAFLVGSEASFRKVRVNVVYGHHRAVESMCSWVLQVGFSTEGRVSVTATREDRNSDEGECWQWSNTSSRFLFFPL